MWSPTFVLRLALVALAAVALGACSKPSAGPGGPPAGWVRLGERAVDFRGDRDTIVVTGEEGRFRSIQLRVHGNGIEMFDLDVQFGNGERQDVSVRSFIEAGGHTRVIDLNGGARVIKKVVFTYKTEGRAAKGKAVVRLFGQRA